MSKFKVGEICIAVADHALRGNLYVGRECEILEVGEFKGSTGIIYEYIIEFYMERKHILGNDEDLKKLPPKDDALEGGFDNCIFKPEGITA